ncbi:WD40-repeat-containing domain protein [Syncephalastrum racemosum]|uniref:WD40-repeat-containing domain protein n=1 Tax=Syncephalastrum racemosum TaxID=13706 RepID=A0A1X2HFV1_SYNRA|nr:WD40-repeat-containing domain protein [Syncephalastrum racemosum]
MMDRYDIPIHSGPDDTISELAFSPVADYLSVSSWDNQILQTRIYEIQATGNSIQRAAYAHEGPVLSTAWNTEGTLVVSGGADGFARVYDIRSGTPSSVAQLREPIKRVRFMDGPQPILVTAGTNTLQYNDVRSPTPMATLNLPERCYSMDLKKNLLVIATSERTVLVFDLRQPTTLFKKVQPSLKHQLRNITCTPDGQGWACGSIEGRVNIACIDEKNSSRNYSFRCHRAEKNKKKEMDVYAVHDIKFHPRYTGTFSTAGADGGVNFWDGNARQRLKPFSAGTGAITCTAFNKDGNLFAYAQGYDWSKGYKFADSNSVHPKIFLHAVQEVEVKPRRNK